MRLRIQQLADDLELVFSGQPWYGDGVMEKLRAIAEPRAMRIERQTGRSVAQLVAHMITWRSFVLNKATNAPDHSVDIDGPEDWPDPASLPPWHELLEKLSGSQSAIQDLLAARDDDWLQTQVPGTQYSFYFLVSGVVQHDIYHLGQIGLLLRMQREQS